MEIGTGTGYTTALLSHRAGDSGVVTVEIDPGLSARAKARLGELGLRPKAVVADGEQGCVSGGPSTASWPPLPSSRSPGRGWSNFAPAVYGGAHGQPVRINLLVHLTGDGNGSAHGHFLEAVTFMRVRGQRAARPARPGLDGRRGNPALGRPTRGRPGRTADPLFDTDR